MNTKFERNSIIVFLFSIMASGLGYLYNILAGRMMSVDVYGDSNALISYISVASLPFLPYCLYVCKLFAQESDCNRIKNGSVANEFFSELTLLILISSPIVSIVSILGYSQRIGWINTILLISSTLICGVFLIQLYIIQGLKNYIHYGLTMIVLNITKIVGLYFLSKYYLNLTTVLIIQLFSYSCALVLEEFYIIHSGLRIKLIPSTKAKQIVDYYKRNTIVVLAQMGLNNGLDLIMINRIYSSSESGLYSVASGLCKIAIMLSAPINTVLFPEIASSSVAKERKQMLVKSIIYSVLIAMCYFVVLFLFGKQVIKLTYGEKYCNATDYFLPCSTMVISITVSNLMYAYYMASEPSILFRFCCVSSLIVIFSLVYFTNSVNSYVYGFSSIILALMTLLLAKEKGSSYEFM